MIRDIVSAFRLIRRNPWISAVAIMSLAIGIGANLTAFAIAKTILWDRLPVTHPDRLIALYNRTPTGTGGYLGLSYPEFRDLSDRRDLFDGLTIYLRLTSLMRAGEETNRITIELAGSNFFPVLGVRPIL